MKKLQLHDTLSRERLEIVPEDGETTVFIAVDQPFMGQLT